MKGLVVCAHCHVSLYSRASGKITQGGQLYRYYACTGKHSPPADTCRLGNINAQSLEQAVIGFLTRMDSSAIASASNGPDNTCPEQILDAVVRLARTISRLERNSQRAMMCSILDRVEVRTFVAAHPNGRRLGMSLRIRAAGVAGAVTVEAQVVLGRKGLVRIIAPFDVMVGDIPRCV